MLEILVAITILAFLMSSVYSIISNTADNKDVMVTEDREKIQLEFAVERIGQDVEQIYSPLYHHSLLDPKKQFSASGDNDGFVENEENSFESSERFPLVTYKGDPVPAIDSPSKDSLIFFSAANRRRIQDSKQSRYVWIKYELVSDEKRGETDDERSGDVLIRKTVADNVYSPDHNWDKVKGYTLLKHVKSLVFSFWNEDTQKFVSSPRELNEKKNQIRMIKMELTWITPDKNELEIVRYVRSMWPIFDVKKDEKIIKEAFRKQLQQDGGQEQLQGQGGSDEDF